ncbi:hypothetical protein [Streptomyces echinatus]|uniref:hypothetical protein n=1 Tax=Streptomyces echinatus TaxID=67293 RepID=UPI0037999459
MSKISKRRRADGTATADLLEDRIRILGPDHPDTLTTQNNLAHWRTAAESDGTGAVG